MPCLRLIEVSKSFGSTPVLKSLDLTVGHGDSLVILGGSGSGKTVLISIMCGLMRCERGRVYLWGEDVTDWTDEEWLPLRKRIGMLFQGGALFDSLDVYENIAFPVRTHRSWTEERVQAQVAERLHWVGLPGIERKYPRELSGGMLKRVALARALALDPDLIFYDEPTAGLDPATAQRITHLIRDLHERLKGTTVTVTHDMHCAFHVADRIAYLENGRILEEGTPEHIRRSEVRSLREFIQGGASNAG